MKIAQLLLLLILPGQSLLADVMPLPSQPHMIIEGEGVVEQIPDIIRVHFEAFATEKNLSLAKQSVDKTIAKAIKAANKNGVKKADINASKIQASPQYEWQKQQRVYIGERVARQVSLKLTLSEHYNDLVEGLLTAGINRLQPPQLDFSQRDELQASALTLALDDAQLQAQTIAKHMNSTIAGIFQITPLSQQAPLQHLSMAVRESKAEESTPLTLGKQKITQRVRVVYLLKENH